MAIFHKGKAAKEKIYGFLGAMAATMSLLPWVKGPLHLKCGTKSCYLVLCLTIKLFSTPSSHIASSPS